MTDNRSNAAALAGAALRSVRWVYAGVALVTSATLILELALTRIFSVIMYHHFTFLAVSLALFGLGAAGVVVYLRPALSTPERWLHGLRRYPLLAALATVLALVIVLRQTVGVGAATHNLLTLTLIYLVAAVPYFLSGMTVKLAVNALQHQMAVLYFVDLLGAALGALCVIPFLSVVGGPGTVLIAAMLLACASLCFVLAEAASLRWRVGAGAAAVVCLGLVGSVAYNPLFHMPSGA